MDRSTAESLGWVFTAEEPPVVEQRVVQPGRAVAEKYLDSETKVELPGESADEVLAAIEAFESRPIQPRPEQPVEPPLVEEGVAA